MEIRFQHSAKETKGMSTEELRNAFLIQDLMIPAKLKLVYTHYDRMIIGGAMPVDSILEIPNHPELRADFFLERREMGIINVGGEGLLTADKKEFRIGKMDCAYIGMGTRSISFQSLQHDQPAVFYILSAPAHQQYPTATCKKLDAAPVSMGDASTSNKRTIYKYIHADGLQSCQLVMGLTVLEEGSVWNSVPPHTHTRRMEAYFYFDLPTEQRLMHFMGEPQETRHLVMSNHEAVLSPPWSVHFGAGTSNYGFIWGMAGENKAYTDMDPAPIPSLK